MRHPPLLSHIVLGQPVWNFTPNESQRTYVAPAWRHPHRDHQYAFMMAAYRRNGGVASGDEVAGRMHKHWDQTVSTVAQWIVTRSLVTFCWQSQTLLPLFQFDQTNMTLRPSVTVVLRELSCTFDEWDLALWFAEPNSWLDNAVPAERVLNDPGAVLTAARADRFIARG